MVQNVDCVSNSLSDDTSELTIHTWMDMGFPVNEVRIRQEKVRGNYLFHHTDDPLRTFKSIIIQEIFLEVGLAQYIWIFNTPAFEGDVFKSCGSYLATESRPCKAT